jgi:hypothetical protein
MLSFSKQCNAFVLHPVINLALSVIYFVVCRIAEPCLADDLETEPSTASDSIRT